eukprot:4234190-Pleurochrysis_carterae.AAC.2
MRHGVQQKAAALKGCSDESRLDTCGKPITRSLSATYSPFTLTYVHSNALNVLPRFAAAGRGGGATVARTPQGHGQPDQGFKPFFPLRL